MEATTINHKKTVGGISNIEHGRNHVEWGMLAVAKNLGGLARLCLGGAFVVNLMENGSKPEKQRCCLIVF